MDLENTDMTDTDLKVWTRSLFTETLVPPQMMKHWIETVFNIQFDCHTKLMAVGFDMSTGQLENTTAMNAEYLEKHAHTAETLADEIEQRMEIEKVADEVGAEIEEGDAEFEAAVVQTRSHGLNRLGLHGAKGLGAVGAVES